MLADPTQRLAFCIVYLRIDSQPSHTTFTPSVMPHPIPRGVKRSAATAHDDFVSYSATARSLRFGAPLCVVDPLLLLLHDIRRLEGSVLSALHSIGADLSQFPPLLRRASTAPEPAFTNAPSAAPSTSDSLGHYIQEVTGCVACSRQEKESTVSAMLGWLDRVHPPQPENGQLYHSSAKAELHRKMLSALVVRDLEGDAIHIIDTARDDSATDGAPLNNDTGGLRHFGSIDASATSAWLRYEEGLRATLREMRSVLNSLCSSTIKDSLSCHAKYVPNHEKSLHTPSSDSVIKNCEEVILLQDRLAMCLREVREAFLSFENKLEMYTDEASVVCERERTYWRSVGHLELEYRALRTVKKHIKRLRTSLPSSAA